MHTWTCMNKCMKCQVPGLAVHVVWRLGGQGVNAWHVGTAGALPSSPPGDRTLSSRGAPAIGLPAWEGTWMHDACRYLAEQGLRGAAVLFGCRYPVCLMPCCKRMLSLRLRGVQVRACSQDVEDTAVCARDTLCHRPWSHLAYRLSKDQGQAVICRFALSMVHAGNSP